MGCPNCAQEVNERNVGVTGLGALMCLRCWWTWTPTKADASALDRARQRWGNAELVAA